jgi:hypothetical protein
VKDVRAFKRVAAGRRYDCDIAHTTSGDLYGTTLHKRRGRRVELRGSEKLRSAEIMTTVGAVLETQDDGDARFKMDRLGREIEIRQANRYSGRRQWIRLRYGSLNTDQQWNEEKFTHVDSP